MVEDRVTDGKRIAQLLASELSGRSDGLLGDVELVDADRDADPSPNGTHAYGVTYRDDRVAAVSLYPSAAELVVRSATRAVAEAARERDLATESDEDSDTVVLRIEYGAAIKRAVDALTDGLSA